jgi:membrane dipeptidase
MLIDLSHSGQKTTIEATELSEKPVAYTHANCITICNNNRNKNDDCLKKLAEKNGIIGINALPKAVKKDPPRSVEDLIDHVDYLKKLIGINHIGIGLDLVEGMKKKKVMPTESVFWRSRRPDMFGSVDDFFDMSYPDGIQSAEEIPNITKGLVDRGYSKSDIQKILGLNTLRVLRETIG